MTDKSAKLRNPIFPKNRISLAQISPAGRNDRQKKLRNPIFPKNRISLAQISPAGRNDKSADFSRWSK
jgi:hypothetical protein